MPTEENNASTDSLNADGQDKVMDSDASAGANAAAPDDTNTATRGSGMEPSEGTSASAIDAEGQPTPAELESSGVISESDDASPDVSSHESEETSQSHDVGGVAAESSQDKKREDAEEIVILPNLGDDHIILPSKSKQTKSETIGDDNQNDGNAGAAEHNLVQKDDISDEQIVDGSSDEARGNIDAEDNILQEELSTEPSESTGPECSGSVEESTASSKEVPTNEPPLCVDAPTETDADSTDDNANEEDADAPGSEETPSGGSSESDAGTQISHSTEVDDSSGSIESSKDETNETSDTDGDANRPTDPNISREHEIEAKAPHPKSEDSTSTEANKTSTDSSETKQGDDSENDEPRQIKRVDYASKLAGAQILEQSSSLKGASNLLTGDKDRYSIAPCEDKKYVVIGLSEDILVKQIKLSNYERYSSRVKEFQVLASQEYPTPNEEYWNSIGTYTAKSKSGEQMFELKEPAWARYLKFRFLSHYGSEHYCTLSQIKVHGSTMLQGFHEQWIESEKKDRELGQGQSQGQEQYQGGVDDVSKSLEEEEVTADGDVIDGADERMGGEQPQEVAKEETASSDQEENENDAVQENIAVDETSDGQAVQVDEHADLTENGEADGTESDSPSLQIEIEAEVEAKEGTESEQDPTGDSTENEGDSGKIVLGNDKSDDGSSELSSGTNVDSQATEDSGGTGSDVPVETAEALVEDGEPNANDQILNGDPTSLPADDLELQEDATNVEKREPAHDQNASSHSELQQSATTDNIREEQPIARNDSSIAAVTDVVKAAVVDASGVIKNATSDAIKNVKDAIRTTVTTAKPDDTANKKEANDATVEQNVDKVTNKKDASEGDLEGNQQLKVESDALKQDDGASSKEAIGTQPDSKSSPKQQTKGEQIKHETPKDVSVKAKVEEASSTKAKVASSSGASSSTGPKQPEKKGEASISLKEDPKSTAPAAGGMLRREAITHAGKEDKELMDASMSAGELYAKLSRRFPHASCMKDLDFQAFKSKTLLANAGSGGTVGSGGGAKMEPIFAKITNEIKSVQVTQNQYEQYISTLKSCYETVFWDMAKDLDSIESSFDQRLSGLERAVFLSEMRSKGGGGPTYHSRSYYDELSKLWSSKGPLAAVSAFQFAAVPPTMQEYSIAFCGGLAIFLILSLTWCVVPRKRTESKVRDSGTVNNMNTCSESQGANSEKRDFNNNVKATSVHFSEPLLTSDTLLDREDAALPGKLEETRDQLADSNGKLNSLQSQHTTLQQEHESLQQRYSRLEETVSALENQISDQMMMTPKREIKHVILNGSGSLCSTPTPSVQSEPAASSEVKTTPIKLGRRVGDSLPLKKTRFLKSKKGK